MYLQAKSKDNPFYIVFNIGTVGSCCGYKCIYDIQILYPKAAAGDADWGGIIYDFSKKPTQEQKEELFLILNKSLSQRGRYVEECAPCAVYIICDYVSGKNNKNMLLTREFAEFCGWETDGITHKNPNSRNFVQMWTKVGRPEPEAHKINPNYEIIEV